MRKEKLILKKSRRVIDRPVLVINRNYQPITTISVKRAILKLYNEIAVIVVPPNEENAIWQELNWDDWSQLKPKDGESVLQASMRVFKIPEIIKTVEYSGVPDREVKLSRRAVYRRDNFTCQYCGKRAPEDLELVELTIDHITPKSKGGKTTWDNIVIACWRCNRQKDNRTPEEARMPLIKLPKPPEYDILKGRNIRVDSWQHFLGDCYWEVTLKD